MTFNPNMYEGECLYGRFDSTMCCGSKEWYGINQEYADADQMLVHLITVWAAAPHYGGAIIMQEVQKDDSLWADDDAPCNYAEDVIRIIRRYKLGKVTRTAEWENPNSENWIRTIIWAIDVDAAQEWASSKASCGLFRNWQEYETRRLRTWGSSY